MAARDGKGRAKVRRGGSGAPREATESNGGRQGPPFFRDPELLDVLSKRLIADLAGDAGRGGTLRVWSPRCGTGEQAYALAIVLLEAIESAGSETSFQLFATDDRPELLDVARAAAYAPEAIAGVDEARLDRFFEKLQSRPRIRPEVRDRCVFARHDAAVDAPLAQIDVVDARAALREVDATEAERLLRAFAWSARHRGYVLLGAGFDGVAAKRLAPVEGSPGLYARRAANDAIQPPVVQAPVAYADGVEPEADRWLASRYAPPAVVVDAHLGILHFRGRTGPYLEPVAGDATLRLLELVNPRLVSPTRATLDEAERTGQPARSAPEVIQIDGASRAITVEAVPLEGGHHLIVFDATPEKAVAGAPERGGAEVARLQAELVTAREYLGAVIDEYEATNEELQSANEEILASNEELQSINEELAAAHEELQAANAELTTLNDELSHRNVELARANADLVNTLGNLDVPVVIVGSDLRVRRFSSLASQDLGLGPEHLGRVVESLSATLGVADLMPQVLAVMQNDRVAEREAMDARGRKRKLAIRPYRTIGEQIDGAILMLSAAE